MADLVEKIDNLTKTATGQIVRQYIRIIIYALLTIQVFGYITGLILGRGIFVLTLFPSLIILLLASLYLGKVNATSNETDFESGLFYSSLFSIYMLVWSLLNGVLKNLFIGKTFLVLFIVAIDIAGFKILKIFLNRNEEFVYYSESIMSNGIFIMYKAPDPIHPGDTIIGYDPITGNPNVQPLKDRYVHTQVYGPTGAGKTSQILLPMILRDLLATNIKSGGIVWDSMGQLVLEPKGDLAEQYFRMANILGGHDPHNVDNPTTINGKKMYYFNPMLINTPKFNPLYGSETLATENVVNAFTGFMSDSSDFFLDLGNLLVRNSMTVVKRLKGNNATLLDLQDVMVNPGGRGEQLVDQFANIPAENSSQEKNNQDVVAWLTDYYSGQKGGMGGSKTYQNASGTRTIIQKLNQNPYLRKALNPKPGEKNNINFNEILAKGDKVAISTAQGALGTELSRYLGTFLMMQIQSAIMHRPGSEDTRRPAMFYVDEFQTFASDSFEDVLTQGRSYRVGLILATQTRKLLQAKVGDAMLANVATNARTLITFPGGDPDDAKQFSEKFGQKKEVQTRISVSRSKSLFGGKAPTESTSNNEELVPIFTPDQIIYGDRIYSALRHGDDNREGNIAFYSMMKNNISQPGKICDTRYIDKKLHDDLGPNIKWYKSKVEINSETGKVEDYDPEHPKPDDPIFKDQSTPATDRQDLVAEQAKEESINNTDLIAENEEQNSDIIADNAVQDPEEIDHQLGAKKSDIGQTMEKELADNKQENRENAALKTDNNDFETEIGGEADSSFGDDDNVEAPDIFSDSNQGKQDKTDNKSDEMNNGEKTITW